MMSWLIVIHLSILVLIVVVLCSWVDEPDYDEDGNYVTVTKRLRTVLVRLFIPRD